jgi:hypothetical protein
MGAMTWALRVGTAVAPFVAVGVLVSCGGTEAPARVAVDVPETVVIGGLPGPFSDTTVPGQAPTTAATTTTTEAAVAPIVAPLVDDVDDHRVLLVGDTALWTTTPRFDGIMCDLVTEFGWDVAIEAEPGRTIDFADQVLDERLDDDWDVVGLMFGHHIATTVDAFERTLIAVLDRLEPRPTLLYTVAEIDEDQVGVNRVLREQADSRPNVIIIDWAAAANEEPELLLDDGGPAPTEEGAGRLALFTVATLGEVPDTEPGECLEPVFADDSAIVL